MASPRKDCETSAKELHHGFFSGCKGCQARAAARSPWYFYSKQAGRQTEQYRGLLATLGLTHEQVKAAEAADYLTTKGKQ
jgi:hypothetical protein